MLRLTCTPREHVLTLALLIPVMRDFYFPLLARFRRVDRFGLLRIFARFRVFNEYLFDWVYEVGMTQ
jgi:hypothetical protein